MVTEKRKYELQRMADKKALALARKTAKILIARNKKNTEALKKVVAAEKRRIAAQKAKKAILSKKARKR